MNPLLQYLKNQKYLSKFSLKDKILKNSVFNKEEFMEEILYYLPTANITRPKILTPTETVNALLENNKSIARFGDGEIRLIRGMDIAYQKYSQSLEWGLKDIIKSQQQNFLIGINYHYFYPYFDLYTDKFTQNFNVNILPKVRRVLLEYVDNNIEYADAAFTGWLKVKNAENDNLYKKLQDIWRNKKVLLVGCQNSMKNLKYDIFDTAEIKEYVYVPNKNAYEEYDSIFSSIKSYDKDYLVILMCGPAGKVLACDLCKEGYRALDLGHIQKSYDFYMKEILPTIDNVENFWLPD